MNTRIPSREDLLAEIERRYQADLCQAKSVRDTAIKAVQDTDPSVIALLASLLAPTAPSAPAVAELPPRDDDIAEFGEWVDGVVARREAQNPPDTNYGGISQAVRAVAMQMEGQFTIRDIVANSVGEPPKATTIAGILKRMEKEGTVRCVLPGSGKRPSRFELLRNASNESRN